MKHKARLVCVAGAFALAAASMAAHAAKPVSKDRQAEIAKVKANFHKAPQPRTMQEAAQTQHRTASGATVASVPEFLWNELHAVRDADGKLQVVETGHGADAAAVRQEGPADE